MQFTLLLRATRIIDGVCLLLFHSHPFFVSYFLSLSFRSYLILGKDIESPSGALGIGPRSIVIEWKDDWYRRMKRFQRRDHACG